MGTTRTVDRNCTVKYVAARTPLDILQIKRWNAGRQDSFKVGDDSMRATAVSMIPGTPNTAKTMKRIIKLQMIFISGQNMSSLLILIVNLKSNIITLWAMEAGWW